MNIARVNSQIEFALSEHFDVIKAKSSMSELERMKGLFEQISTLISSSKTPEQLDYLKNLSDEIKVAIGSDSRCLEIFQHTIQAAQEKCHAKASTPLRKDKKNSSDIPIDPIVTHGAIEKIIKLLGHLGGEIGVCSGVAKASLKYIIARNIHKFDMHVKNMEILLLRLQEKNIPLETLTKENVLECCQEISPSFYGLIQNFLSKVDLLFNKEKYVEILKEESFTSKKKKTKPIPITSSALNKEADLLGGFVNIYTQESLGETLETLKQVTLKNESDTTFAFSLNNLNHEVVISYDSSQNNWIVVDVNKLHLRRVATTTHLSNELMRSFFTGINPLSISVYGKEPQPTGITDQINAMQKDSNLSPQECSACALFAARDGLLDNLRAFAARGIDLSTPINGVTPLYMACQQGHLDVVKFLLKESVDINTAEPSGATALFIATQKGFASIVRLLVSHEAQANKPRQDGMIPLAAAAAKGNAAIVKLLAKHTFNINHVDDEGATALLIAADAEKWDVVRVLLELGADPNIPKKGGITPLLLAVDGGSLEAVKWLLEHNANPNDAESGGFTPLLLAQHKGREDLAQILLAHKAH